jgi:hypothetical protein
VGQWVGSPSRLLIASSTLLLITCHLPPVVRFPPTTTEDVGEEALGELVPARSAGERDRGVGQRRRPVVDDETLGLELADHLAHRRRLTCRRWRCAPDHADIVSASSSEDALAVLLEGGVVLSGACMRDPTPKRLPPPD